MPKATVKLNQTVPISAPMPAPSIKTVGVTTTTPKTPDEDPMMLPLSIVAFLAAIFAIATALIAG